MPIQVNVPVTPKTQAPDIPAGLFCCIEITLKHLDVYYGLTYYVSKAAYNNGAQPISTNDIPDAFPKGLLQYTLTPAQYAATPDLIGIIHTQLQNAIETVVGNGNTSLVNYD